MPFPRGDRPGPAARRDLKGCESAALYYGIGVAPDPARARHCAYLELDDGDGLVFGGSAVLMMIYANGWGVQRDLDLALQLACQLEGAPAEMARRIAHLQRLRHQAEKRPFDLCDDVTSGLMTGHCAGRDERLAKATREREIASLVSSWSAREQRAFKALRRSADRFFQARVKGEVDLSGTARAALQVEEEGRLRQGVISALQRFEAGRLPAHSPAAYKAADRALNDVYRQLQRNQAFAYGTVTRQAIKLTQHAWLRYRDAWIAFGRVKYPAVRAASVLTWLTRQRTAQLKAFLD